MEENIGEKISALVDGELAGPDVHALVNDLRHNPESRMCWQHYHLISDALRNNLPEVIAGDLASRVSQALESEPPLNSLSMVSRSRRFPTFIKPAVGFAIAASVAGLAYLGFGWKADDTVVDLQRTASVSTPTLPASVTNNPAGLEVHRAVNGTHWDVTQPAVESKLNDYLLNHDEYATYAGGQRGVLPHVRTVGYDPADPAQ